MGVIASGELVVSYSPSSGDVVYTGPTGAILNGVTLTNWTSAGTVTGLDIDADDITVDASGFSGNLSTADTDAQKALVTIDEMTAGGDLTGVLVTGGNLTISSATGPVPTIGLTSGQIVTAAGVANYLPLAGGALSGALTTSSTLDTRDVSTDGTKLDTIAENADVTFDALPGTTKGDVIMYNGSTYIRVGVGTDTQVLTADDAVASGVKWADAGGDGDLTEVQVSGGLLTVTSGTGPVPVVGVTTAAVQAATAIYLPLAGGALSGALTTSSTIAGRDVSTDGTKLDTIAENADVTATANVVAALAAITDSAQGDVIVHNGSTYIRLGVGTDTHVLTADSGEASGVKWAASGGGGGGGGFGVIAAADWLSFNESGDSWAHLIGEIDSADHRIEGVSIHSTDTGVQIGRLKSTFHIPRGSVSLAGTDCLKIKLWSDAASDGDCAIEGLHIYGSTAAGVFSTIFTESEVQPASADTPIVLTYDDGDAEFQAAASTMFDYYTVEIELSSKDSLAVWIHQVSLEFSP